MNPKRSMELLVEMSKLLGFPENVAVDEHVLSQAQEFIKTNERFCSELVYPVQEPVLVLGTHSVDVNKKIEDVASKDPTFVPRLAQLMRKVYNNTQTDELCKIKRNRVSSAQSTSPQSMDPNWLMNVVGAVMALYSAKKSSITPSLILECLPSELTRVIELSTQCISANLEEHPVDIARTMLNDDTCREALKVAYPLVTKEHVNRTIESTIQTMYRTLDVPYSPSQGLPPMMQSMLAMLGTPPTGPL